MIVKATTSGPHQFCLHCKISPSGSILAACSMVKVYIAQMLMLCYHHFYVVFMSFLQQNSLILEAASECKKKVFGFL